MDILIGFGTIIIVCVLVIVLGMQIQLRTLSSKIDRVLEKLGSD